MSKPEETTREARLKAALKANMGRRKAQARARTAPEAAMQDDAASDADEAGDTP
jgi:hypothetical protein